MARRFGGRSRAPSPPRALYFVLFNLWLIALLTPVTVDARVRTLDWPVLVGVTWLATAFLARSRVSRAEGVVLVAAYGLYVAALMAP